MTLTTLDILFVAGCIGALLDRVKGSFWLFALVALPGTLCHEACHWGVALVSNGRPQSLSLIPKRSGQQYLLGEVIIGNTQWYNASLISLAPLLMWVMAYRLCVSRAVAWPMGWEEALLRAYLIANLLHGGVPSSRDWAVALSKPVGLFLVLFVACWVGTRYASF